jgi:hypothetical protein
MPSLVDVVLRKKQEAICLELGNQEGFAGKLRGSSLSLDRSNCTLASALSTIRRTVAMPPPSVQ